MKSKLECLTQFTIDFPIQQLRAARFENAGRSGLILAHAATPDQQPSHPTFHWPKDTLKISAFSLKGEHLWQHDVGKGVIPGLWYCPVFPFDLDGDGRDEVYHIGNPDPDKPLDTNAMEITGLSSQTGGVLGSAKLPWFPKNESMSDTFRYLINGGYSHGKARLVIAQGCYHELCIHAWESGLKPLWTRYIPNSEPGCRASHMFPVLDIDGDGRDEVFLGERCIDIDTGEDKWVAERDGYHGHSDVMMPTLDRQSGRWRLYTTREFPWPEGSRGVVMFDERGQELWGYRGMGHMHDGWTARLCDDGSHLCYALEIVQEGKGQNEKITATVPYLYDMAGKKLKPAFELQGTQPVDVDGDGCHELVGQMTYPFNIIGGLGDRVGGVIDRHGQAIGRIEGHDFLRSKILDCPGEQIVTNCGKGLIRFYGCPGATDSPEAKARYAHPYYKSCQRLTAVGYNWRNLGGL